MPPSKAERLSGVRAEDRCGWARHRRLAPADAGSAERDPYGMEFAQGRFCRRRIVRQQRFHDPLCGDKGGAAQDRRSAAVDGRALSERRAIARRRSQKRPSNWCRTGCCWKRTQNCSRRTPTEGLRYFQRKHLENANADATQYDACLYRCRSDHEYPNRSGESRAAIDAGEFRHSRRRLRLPHPYPPGSCEIPVLRRPRLHPGTGVARRDDGPAQGAAYGARGDRHAKHLRPG